ncbi:MAG: universal stress protein [Alphaproteobacteria bacterium]|nr:universal stress protein [Alphaproteobacteria bacterium]
MAKAKKTEMRSDRVFLVVIDDSEELHQALYYACRRAARVDARIALLYCIPPAEFQHWAGVGELMRDEAREQAENLLGTNAEYVNELTGTQAMVYLREGEPKSELINLINEEDDISMLILGANTNGENSGPLINYLTNKGAAECRVPITIVPGNLSDEDIDHLT